MYKIGTICVYSQSVDVLVAFWAILLTIVPEM